MQGMDLTLPANNTPKTFQFLEGEGLARRFAETAKTVPNRFQRC